MTQTRTRRRAHRPAGPPEPATTACRCKNGPVTVATFRRQQLVAIERRHLRLERCGLPVEQVEPVQWLRERRLLVDHR